MPLYPVHNAFAWDFTTLGQFFSMIVSALICVSSVICAGLYRRAYFQMKKTKIILAVSLIFWVLAFKFFVTSIGYFFIFSHYPPFDAYFFNALNSFPNIFLLYVTINFIHQSIKTPNQAKDCLQAINDQDIRKL